MCSEHRIFRRRSGQVGAISRNAAGKDESADRGISSAIGLGDGLHYSRRTGNINLPHALIVEHTCAHGVDYEGKMYDRNWSCVAQQFVEYAGRRLLTQIEMLELERQFGLGRTEIHPNHREIPQQRKQPGSEV